MANEQWDMLVFEQGAIAVVARDKRVCRVCYECTPEDAAAAVARHYPEARKTAQPYIQQALEQLAEYFRGKRREFDVPLENGALSDFARKVQQALSEVPYGAVVTYGELAARVGSPRAARAVGRVMSSNPFPLLVPCHRVVNADGSLGQYSAAHGTDSKAWLIDFEHELVGE